MLEYVFMPDEESVKKGQAKFNEFKKNRKHLQFIELEPTLKHILLDKTNYL